MWKLSLRIHLSLGKAMIVSGHKRVEVGVMGWVGPIGMGLSMENLLGNKG